MTEQEILESYRNHVDRITAERDALLAEAWELGYGAGRDDEAEGRNHRDPHRTPNPYKETAR